MLRIGNLLTLIIQSADIFQRLSAVQFTIVVTLHTDSEYENLKRQLI